MRDVGWEGDYHPFYSPWVGTGSWCTLSEVPTVHLSSAHKKPQTPWFSDTDWEYTPTRTDQSPSSPSLTLNSCVGDYPLPVTVNRHPTYILGVPSVVVTLEEVPKKGVFCGTSPFSLETSISSSSSEEEDKVTDLLPITSVVPMESRTRVLETSSVSLWRPLSTESPVLVYVVGVFCHEKGVREEGPGAPSSYRLPSMSHPSSTSVLLSSTGSGTVSVEVGDFRGVEFVGSFPLPSKFNLSTNIKSIMELNPT